MHVSRGVFDVAAAIRKMDSRFRRPLRISRPQWPVISATRPLFYLIRLFGLAPFGISQGHFISGESYDVVYSLFCTIVHTYAIYMMFNKPTPDKRETVLLDIIETGKIILNYCIVIFNIVTAVWTRNKFIKVLNIVEHFDSRISDLGYPRKERATKIWVWSTCVCIAVVWTAVSRLGMIAFNEFWIDNVAYLLGYLSASLSTIKFSNAVLLLGQRFRHLNKIAKVGRDSLTARVKYPAINLKVIGQLHNSLMNAGENLNSQYAWSLLLWLINLCVHSVSNIYFLIDWIMVTPDWAETPWILLSCLVWWLVTYISQLLLLHIACHFTSSEVNIHLLSFVANSIGSIVIDRNFLAVSQNYSVESSVHFINRQLNFSAAGCFYMNMSLLRSITALLTTYLVLLFQFHH